MPAIPHGFPQSSEEALITHQAEGEDPLRAQAHDVDASLAEEAAKAVFKGKKF